MGPKLVQTLIFFGFIFGSLVFEVLELFGCLLGAFMGLWSLSWEASGPQKPEKQTWFFKVFANAGFWVFEALGGPLGPILAPSWADLVPKWSPKWPQKWSKKCSKMCSKNEPRNSPQNASFGPQNGPKIGVKTSDTPWRKPPRAVSWRKMAPRWP